MWIPILVLGCVFVLIAVRQIGPHRVQIWHVMLAGAVVVVALGQIPPLAALRSINPGVMFFLLSMFVIGKAVEASGYLAHLSYLLFKRARSTDQIILAALFGFGLLSALLLNDTIAIVGTPVVLLLASKHRISPKLLLLTLCFAITIGSVPSPIGNPQNVLIAVEGRVPNAFVTFAWYLFLPTMINLGIAFVILKIFFRKDFHTDRLEHLPEGIADRSLARLARLSLLLLLALITAKILLVFEGIDFPITWIAVLSAIPVLLSRRRLEMVRGADWPTLVFFAAMFVLMESVWRTGLFQSILRTLELRSTFMILIISALASQLISNVPLVSLFLPLFELSGAGTVQLMALAAGSTIAGNVLILGAASNVIVIQGAEKRGSTLTLREFATVGIPLTVLNLVVYWLFL